MMLRKFLLASALLGLCASLSAAPASRPNILFCISDDQSFPHASAYGCPWVKTPAFDRIAREGLLFMRAYTPNAKCAPSRACVLTGRNSWQLEEAANHAGFYPKGEKYHSFVEALGSKGYFTGYTGKPWGPGNPGTMNGHPRQLAGPAYSQLKTKPPTSAMSNVDYSANFAAFLKKRPAGQPFCFWYGGFEPHRRYERGSGIKLGGKKLEQIDRVPAFWPDDPTVRSDMLDYAFEIEYFDHHLGQILAALEATGELENTLIVVTGDNGMPFPRSKGTTYEISNHLPLAIRWGKGIAKPGRKVDDYVSFIDLAPTFLEAAGVTEQESGMAAITGKSLGPIFRVPAPQPGRVQPGRDRLFMGQERHDIGRPHDVGYPVRGLYRDGFLYLHNFEPTRWPQCDPITGYLNTDGSPTKSLILDQNRHGVNHWLWELSFGRRPSEELYDLRKDMDCMVNLALEPALQARRDAMRQELFAELTAQQDPRMRGEGAVFDNYPHGTPHFYERFMKGEKVRAGWVEDSDFEKPGFDPERPLRTAEKPALR